MIDLARCDDFTLGPVAVRPSSRELVTAAGAVTAEPKVMQVLVALARADGRVVSRDELVEQCWPGRIVGDDAINRVIGKLRRVADALGPDAFTIQTVARTGYRLVRPATPPPEPVAAAPAPAGSPHPPRRRAAIAAAAVAVALAGGVFVASHRRAPPTPPQPMPAAVSDLETRGLSAAFENTPEQTTAGIAYLRQAAALAPRASPVWGSLAMSYVIDLGWLPPADRPAGAARVRDAAAHGLALDPGEPRSTAALVSLAPTFGHWSDKAGALAAAARRARPDAGPLTYQRLQFLMAVGRDRAALAEVSRIAPASPLVPWIRAAQIDLLAAAGRLVEADAAAAAAQAIWPRDRLIWFTRFDLAMYNGGEARALAMAADRAGWPKQTTPAEVALAAATTQALAARNPATTAALVERLQAAATHGHAAAERAIRAAAALGRSDVALAVARRLYLGRLPAEPRATLLPLIGMPADADPPTAALFLPPATALAADPGFARLMRDIGLAAYWRRSGAPDLCRAAEAQTACRAMALVH